MSRFLAIFEATLLPVEWTIDSFDQFLDPGTAPTGFLPWLASWYGLTFDSTWTEPQRRQLLSEAHAIYARRGTQWALGRVLEIYTGAEPEIDDEAKDLDPFTFSVVVPRRKRDVRSDLIEALIDAHKPAHTSYKLRFKG
jgi:phage tail-like protein